MSLAKACKKPALRGLLLFALMAGLCSSLLCCASLGHNPEGADLARMEQSPNYRDGKFHNQIPTPMFAEGENFFTALFGGMFTSAKNLKPDEALPAIHADLKNLPDNSLVWLGHSSWLFKINNKTILVDPVIENYAAPVALFNRAFKGTTIFTPADFPDIDYLLLTHDHWDHLEYPTLKELAPKIKTVVCPLGVGSHLKAWGFAPDKIIEQDWHDKLDAGDGLALHVIPARHFSGRLLTRDKTLWAGYAIITPRTKIFISGDSGYGPHFREAGAKFGGFDLAILENGQYDARWPHIHMFPEETARAGEDLQAKRVAPNHNGRFAMARHAWDEPVRRLAEAAKDKSYELIIPKIGKIMALPAPQ